MTGRTVREIATERGVSEGTVRSQVKALLAKLEVQSQISAVALAYSAGWTPGPTRFPPAVHSPASSHSVSPARRERGTLASKETSRRHPVG